MKLPEYPIPMACQSATVELRGQLDVSDKLSSMDARALFRFLQKRGYISMESNVVLNHPDDMNRFPLKLLYPGTSLAAVDSVTVNNAGLIVWKVELGDLVKKGQFIGEIINIENIDTPRIPIYAQCDGLVFTKSTHLCRPGQRIMKIAGNETLNWRTGNLLSL